MLDRFDLFTELSSVKLSDIKLKKYRAKSKEIRERVTQARNIQLKRYDKVGIKINSELSNTQIDEFCKIDTKGKELIDMFYEKNKISVRAYNKIIKVARTIADLEFKENIEYKHIAEALQYRKKEEFL